MYHIKFSNPISQKSFVSNKILLKDNILFISLDFESSGSISDLKPNHIGISINHQDLLSDIKITNIYMKKLGLAINIESHEIPADFIDFKVFSNINKMILQKERVWFRYNYQDKFSWLRSSFYYKRQKLSYKKNIDIDGNYIKNKLDFFCEFSEKVSGVGSYFCSDLDGFYDCIDLHGLDDLIIKWFNFRSFSDSNEIIKILTENGINIILNPS